MGTDKDLLALGREIRKHRKALGISQEELAERAGLHRNHIGFLERGERNPRVKALFGIAHALGIGLAELTANVAEPRRSPRGR